MHLPGRKQIHHFIIHTLPWKQGRARLIPDNETIEMFDVLIEFVISEVPNAGFVQNSQSFGYVCESVATCILQRETEQLRTSSSSAQ
jgi:hypothetical protein